MPNKGGQTDLYVVSYDVTSDRRRNKVHRALTGFGEWVQLSVFECYLSKKEVLLMRSKLSELIDAKEDRVRVYQLCAACALKVDAIGCEGPKEKTVYVV